MTDLPPSAFAKHLVVDGDRCVIESDVPGLDVGAQVTPSSWLGDAVLLAIEGVAQASGPYRGEGRDFARGTHWLVEATVLPVDPWRAHLTLTDVTLVVEADRRAVHAKLAHAMRNVSFAVLSVVDALAGNRPTGADLDRYLTHLRLPAESLAQTMARFEACLSAPAPLLARVTVRAWVDDALSRVAPACRPASPSLLAGDDAVWGDARLLADTVVSMLESGGTRAVPSLEADRVHVGGRPHVRIVVTRSAARHELRAVAGLWDLAGGVGLDVPLRLAFGRAVVLAHGGEVTSELASGGGVRLAVLLPILRPRDDIAL